MGGGSERPLSITIRRNVFLNWEGSSGSNFPAMFARFHVDVLDDPLVFTGGYSFRTLSTLRVRLRPLSHRLSAA